MKLKNLQEAQLVNARCRVDKEIIEYLLNEFGDALGGTIKPSQKNMNYMLFLALDFASSNSSEFIDEFVDDQVSLEDFE